MFKKSPTQMRREAEARKNAPPKQKPLTRADAARLEAELRPQRPTLSR